MELEINLKIKTVKNEKVGTHNSCAPSQMMFVE